MFQIFEPNLHGAQTLGPLSHLNDLRRVNHLIWLDYDSHNFPITAGADASAHLSSKKFFAKLDCTQAYHALKMTDLVSIQLLFFSFVFRTFAYLRLPQKLSESMSAFSWFMRKYMDPCIAADPRFQFVDDLGTAGHIIEEAILNLSEFFKLHQTSCFEINNAQMWIWIGGN